MEKYKQDKFPLDKLKKTEVRINLKDNKVLMLHDRTIQEKLRSSVQ